MAKGKKSTGSSNSVADYPLCRGVDHHQWRIDKTLLLTTNAFVVRKTCVECATQCERHLNYRTGDHEKTKYHYPDDYLYARGAEKLDRKQARLAGMKVVLAGRKVKAA